MGQQRSVVLVGRRKAAREAATALGLDVTEIAIDRTATADDRWIDRGRTLIDERESIGAIVAVTEAAVLPAALIARGAGLEDRLEMARRTTDKLAMKRAVAAHGLPCARFAGDDEALDRAALIERLGLPMVLKTRIGSGGRGLSILRRRHDVPERLPPGTIAESYVRGTEMSVEALIEGGEPAFINPTEYLRLRFANIVPAVLDVGVRRKIRALTRGAVAALGVVRGMVHMEIFLGPAGPIFGELASRPPGGHIMDLIERAYGFDPWQAFLRLGLGDAVALPRRARRSAGVWMLHPGAGIVRRVDGVERARAIAGVTVRLRAKPGSRVAERLGSGQEIGHLLVVGRDRADTVDRLRRGRRSLRFHLAR